MDRSTISRLLIRRARAVGVYALALVACAEPRSDAKKRASDAAEPRRDAAAADATAPPPPTAAETATPPTAAAKVQIVSLATLGNSTCAAASDGTWRCWGSARNGALGSAAQPETCGTEKVPAPCVRGPVRLDGPADAAVLVGNGETFCALGRDARVSCWGLATSGTLAQSNGDSDCQIKDGRLLPRCTEGPDCAKQRARSRPCAAKPVAIPGLADVRAIGAGSRFFCALTDAGTACWGDNHAGKLGLAAEEVEDCEKLSPGTFVVGGTGCSPTPRIVPGLPPTSAIAIGFESGAALTKNGRVFTWGSNIAGQLGRADEARVGEVKKLRDVVEIGLGHYTVCARLKNGTLSCWGDHSSGEAGLGKRPADKYGVVKIPAPETVRGLADVKGLAMHPAASHTCALLADGTVWCWGANDTGQLGLGDLNQRTEPTRVPGLADVERLVIGGQHTCALVRSGAVLCFGANHLGQLGTSAAKDTCKLPFLDDASVVACSTTPLPVEGL